MKKFKFSLGKVLEIKEVEEKVIQKKLLLIQNEISETEKKIISVKENISCQRKEICILSLSVINTVEVMLYYKYIESLNNEVEFLTSHIKKLKINEDNIKKQLIEKSREKKALERLKEIKYEEYRKEYKKEQQLFIDDMSIQNHRFRVGNI